MTDKQHLEQLAKTGRCYHLDCAQCVKIFNGKWLCKDARASTHGYGRHKQQEAAFVLSTMQTNFIQPKTTKEETK